MSVWSAVRSTSSIKSICKVSNKGKFKILRKEKGSILSMKAK
jgi:hypothetical protein